MSTVANVAKTESGHWYTKTGEPAYSVQRSDGKGARPTTLRDARKLDLLPSVTTILRTLHRPALERWLIEQSVLACLTSPRHDGEALDTFVDRVLNTEKVQDQEGQKARDLGTAVHQAIEDAITGGVIDPVLDVYVSPVVQALKDIGIVQCAEKVVIGDGYAGKLDCLCAGNALVVVDFKTCKKLPKEPYREHLCQTAAYAQALGNTSDKAISTALIYISTTEPSAITVCHNPDWHQTYHEGFKPLVRHWQWANNYYPQQGGIA